MKTAQKGFIAYIVIVAIALIVVGGGTAAYYSNEKFSPKLNQIVTPLPSEITSVVVQSASSSNVVTESDKITTEINKPAPKPLAESLKTYTNTKFGFKFSHPISWKMTGEIGGNYKPPFLFDEILSTANHPINKAGHVSVLALTTDQLVAELKKDATLKIQTTSDVKTTNLKGKKITTVSGQQTDYKYLLPLGKNTLFINFTSMNTSEGKISKELEGKIDQMIATVSSIPTVTAPVSVLPANLQIVKTSALINSTVSVGSQGEDVMVLQQFLISKGFMIANLDSVGVFGVATEAGLKNYQMSINVTPDGVTGPATREKLNMDM